MNRFGKYISSAAGDARILALKIQCSGDRRLILDRRKGALLRRCIDETTRTSGDCEALRRLKAETPRLRALLENAKEQDAPRLPSEGRAARLLQLARLLVAGGEEHIGIEDILSSACAFNVVQDMHMREIQRLPDALRIALCESLALLGDDVLRFCRDQRRAKDWICAGGRRPLPHRPRPAFCAQALKMAADLERPDLHARLEKRIDRLGCRSDDMLKQAHALTADHCLRMENLLHLKRLLENLNWEPCFIRISPAEQELRADPADVYDGMDDASRAYVRRLLADLARQAGMDELSMASCALREARSACREHGRQDPRATVCWYISEDAGRRQLFSVLGLKKPNRCVPDASGRKTALIAGGTAAVIAFLLAWMFGSAFLAIYALPLAWVLGMQLIGRIYPRWVKPRPLLKLDIRQVPDNAKTLVVLPVLLSSESRAREMVRQMETLGCMEQDANIDFLLLGDFRDAISPTLPDDAAIIACARSGVERLNANGRKKYFYLHRNRSHRTQDDRWMGKNRKRGALMALNRLLLNDPGAQYAFDAEGDDASALAGRYRYVVTLDSDTQYLPGTLQKLIGTMMHPLNRACAPGAVRRGYAVLQPAMLPDAEACASAYARLMHGEGGLDGYPVTLSEFYQDMTGHGCFAGKGIYDVRPFACANADVPNDDCILSHDLIEGILSGAGGVNDVFFYDGCPNRLEDDLARQHRWIRGDWQLLPLMFSRLQISAADRIKLIGNLLRSLYAPALLALLVHSAWLNESIAFAIGLLTAFHTALIYPGRNTWRRALLELAVLPERAYCAMDAVLRTLWRLAFSKKHLMDWVTAADADSKGNSKHRAGGMAILLLLPALLRSGWLAPVLALAALFFIGPAWAGDLARPAARNRELLSSEQASFLLDIARRTWHFFEIHVPMDGCALPPDNVQLDPPSNPAMRTSPTNIGLYLAGCLGAHRLGLIGEDEMLTRIQATVSALEKLEKWNGQLYNWYDLNTLQPMHPRYVSSVDSGNLAGCLLLCAHALQDKQLSSRILRLAENMNLAALYDSEKDLFYIGMDADANRLSRSHYDLYASESRILSYSAMMLGQVPLRHWQRLGRPMVRCGRYAALAGWSGTMFETLMPDLLLKYPENTLAGQNRRGAVACQMEYGRAMQRPWGVSESGYYAFDLHLNYQYRAFGLKALALDPNAAQDVVAPYASALALMVRPAEAAENLMRMCGMGWWGEMGMYEAADYQDGKHPRIVRSHMAHHQGMTLCAICNVLCDNYLSRSFMDIPRARALRLLLQEKQTSLRAIHNRKEIPVLQKSPGPDNLPFMRRGKPVSFAADVHLLQGGGTSALVTARGAVFAWKDGWQINRFFGRISDPHEGMYVHLRNPQSGKSCVIGDGCRSGFDAGYARFDQNFENTAASMRVFISPEDGTLYQQLQFTNNAKEPCCLEITGCLAVALAKEKDMRAHPVFQNLFVGSRIQDDALLFHRRSRDKSEACPQLAYLLQGAQILEYETDLEKLTGRRGALGMAGQLRQELTRSTGNTLNPCAAIRTRIHLEAGETRRLHFALALIEDTDLEQCLHRIRMPSASQRALQLSAAQARAMLGHMELEPSMFHLLQRCAALILDPRLRPHGAQQPQPPMQKSLLWQAGISGDLPILLAEVSGEAGLDCVRDVIHIHAFYRSMGVKMDFVLIDHHNSDYIQPERAALGDLIASSHLNGSFFQPGGAFILERRSLNSDSYAAILRSCALRFDAQHDSLSQLRDMADTLRLRPDSASLSAMQPSALPPTGDLRFFNGFGGFDERGYVIPVGRNALPPAPWCNVLASETSGAIVSERGGGFAWHGNSRHDRLTPFENNPLQEGWGWMFYLLDEDRETYLRLLPGNTPMTDFIVRHEPGTSSWASAAHDLAFRLEMRAQTQGVRFDILLENTSSRLLQLRIAGMVNWLMGTDDGDAAMTRCWAQSGSCFASGTAQGVGVFACDDPRTKAGWDSMRLPGLENLMQFDGFVQAAPANGGCALHVPVILRPGEKRTCRFLLGGAGDISRAQALARAFRNGEALRRSRMDFSEWIDKLRVTTPDAAVNLLANGFLQAQILNGRILGRTGLYQGGGAYGFRDQLQDMLPMIHYAPEMVKTHLLRCAARQFEAGDVLHWWHEPYNGVRTRISDDLLFLPLVTAQYVRVTGDDAVLQENAPFLQDIAIPDDREDVYAPMQPTAHTASLHRHCMLALRRAARTGSHGLCLMGSGDWNDGMNRVGCRGLGESVWLSQFLAVCAAEYAQICPNADDRAWLLALNERMTAAVEEHGWDGKWYLRAYADDGRKIGSSESACCRIDLICQAWSTLAGLDANRSRSAMDEAWRQLADSDLQVLRLLHPPFDGRDFDPGYIAAYPPGVRENGAQYTHAACWMLCALVRQGNAERAHRALNMLLPVNHTRTREQAEVYRVEPYVMAADIYTGDEHAGRGGWTWYTGSAAWMLMGIWMLLGFERRKNRVRLHALLHDWPEVSLQIRHGLSLYTLCCRQDVQKITLDGEAAEGDFIEMIDDGREHFALFPPRQPGMKSPSDNEVFKCIYT